MALISAQLGFPYLFVTFTCNLNWPKIQRLIKPMSLIAQNRLDMVSRVFKLKLDNLLTNLKKNQIFRRVVACTLFFLFAIYLVLWYTFYKHNWRGYNYMQIYTQSSYRREGCLMLTLCYSYIRQTSIQVLRILIEWY